MLPVTPSPTCKSMKEISFQTRSLETQLNLPGTAQADSALSMPHFHGEHMGRHQVRFTPWKQLRDAGAGE